VEIFHDPTGLPSLRKYAAEALALIQDDIEPNQPGVNSTMPLLHKNLKKRYSEVGDTIWNENISKGFNLLYQMSASDHEAGQAFTAKTGSAASTFLEYPSMLKEIVKTMK
jgi:hypothetical protein